MAIIRIQVPYLEIHSPNPQLYVDIRQLQTNISKIYYYLSTFLFKFILFKYPWNSCFENEIWKKYFKNDENSDEKMVIR